MPKSPTGCGSTPRPGLHSLPQFGRIAHATCSYATLGARVSVLFDQLISSLADDEFIDVAFSDDLHRELIEAAMPDGGAAHSALARRKLRPRNVYDIVGFGQGKLAANNYFTSQEAALISTHHSLCDARALRLPHNASAKSRTSDGVAEPQAGDPFRVRAAPSSLVVAATTMLAERRKQPSQLGRHEFRRYGPWARQARRGSRRVLAVMILGNMVIAASSLAASAPGIGVRAICEARAMSHRHPASIRGP